MSRDVHLYLQDIRTCCERVLRYTHNMTRDEWLADEMAYDATLRNLEIIGEAVAHLPENVRDRHPEVEWRQIRAFRNVVAHHYFALDTDLVWDVIENRIADLLTQIQKVIASEQDMGAAE